MKLLAFLRSSRYWQFAIGAWLLSFLLLPGSQPQNNLTYAIVIIPLLLSLQKIELVKFSSDILSQGLMLVIVALIGASFIAGDPLSTAKFGLIVLLFYIAVARVPEISRRAAYSIAWAVLLALIVYVIGNMVWKYHQGTWIPGKRLSDMSGKLENPIYVTDMMGCMLGIITLLGIERKKYGQILVAHGLTLLFTLAALQTRSILLLWGAIALLSYSLLSRQSSSNKLKINWTIVGLLMLGTVLIGAIIFYTPLGEKLLARNFYRPEIWHAFIRETFNCGVWFGCGPEHGYRYTAHDGMIIVNAHNIFIAQFYKAGLVGLIPLIFITIVGGIYGFKSRHWAGWYFIVGATGLLVDGSSLIHSPNMRWLVFHLPLAFLIAHRIKAGPRPTHCNSKLSCNCQADSRR